MEFKRALCGLAILFLSACADYRDPLAPVEPQLVFSTEFLVSRATARVGLLATPRFSINFSVFGSLTPGSDVRIDATIRTEQPSATPEAFMIFPEVDAANATGWGHDFRVGLRTPDRHAATPVSQTQGSTSSLSGEFRAAAPGYYRVVITARDPGALRGGASDQGIPIVNSVHREVWILIDHDGGRVTEDFDTTIFPLGTRHQPGPFRADHRRARKSASLLGLLAAPIKSVARILGTTRSSWVSYEIKWLNYDTGQYEPVPLARYQVDHLEYVPNSEEFDTVGHSTGYSTTGGSILFECLGDEYSGVVTFHNYQVEILGSGGGGLVGDSSDCDQPDPMEIVMNSPQARVFTTMLAARDSSVSFGTPRGKIQVVLSSSVARSKYTPGTDRITIKDNANPSDIWDAWGGFIQAHEYGHAFHEKALGGNAASGQCGGSHSFSQKINLQCAFSEGWADFFGYIVRPQYHGAIFENNGYYTSGNASTAEGPVAAFFLDLVDTGTEAHDGVTYPRTYVAGLVKTCRVDNHQVDGVDFFIYCAENRLENSQQFALVRYGNIYQSPSNYSEQVTEPASWDPDAIEQVWLANLFGG